MRVGRPVAAAAVLVLLAGCGNPQADKDRTAEQLAATLAASLSNGTTDGVRIRSGDPEKDLPAILQGMDGLLPVVTVKDVRHAAGSAFVDLTYAWPLSAPWTYTTEALIVERGKHWELHWKPDVVHPKLTENNRLQRVRGEVSERGNLTGRGQMVLVQNLPMQLLGLNKTGLDPATADASARRIADDVSINADGFAAKVRAAPPDAFVDALPVRPEEVSPAFKEVRGAEQRTVTLPAAKTSGYARAVLGTVGYASAEQARASGIVPGDIVGTSGLQKAYDDELRGGTGSKVYVTDRSLPVDQPPPKQAKLVADFPDRPGRSVETTLDDNLQTAAENALADVTVPASVVVLHKDSGAILAAADSPLARRGNDSIEARFQPGLSAGPVAALALMRSGVNLSQRVTCEPQVLIGDRRFDNGPAFAENGRTMTIAHAIATNCVTAVAQAAARVAPDKVPEAAHTLGLATNYNLGILLNFGDYPAPQDPVAKAEALVGDGGRGRVHVSPAALAAMAATVDQRRTVVPHVVPGRDPQAVSAIPPLTETERRTLRNLMADGLSGYAGLSGVATGKSDQRAWAVGYNGDLAIAVVVHDGGDRGTPEQVIRAVSNASSVR